MRNQSRRRDRFVTLLALVAVGACSGKVGPRDQGESGGDGNGDGTDQGRGGSGPDAPSVQVPPPPPGWPVTKPGPAALRRLTADEYRATLQALLGAPSQRTEELEADPVNKAGFVNFGSELVVSPTLAAQYAAIAAAVAKDFAVPACTKAEPACASEFIARFGARAFRRPLTKEESTRYEALYADERARTNHAGGVRQVVETLLQSPKFLYRSELGAPAAGATRRLTSFEVASELSYLLAGSMPDAELFAAAEADKLTTPAGIEAEARRLMKAPAARTQLRSFVSAFAGLARFGDLSKNAEAFPSFTPALKSAMKAETDRFIDDVLWEGDGTWKSLLTAPYSFVNDSLAKHYGLASPGKGDTLVKTTLDRRQRAGLLTQASVLAAHSKAEESFPILRGKFVRVGLLCQSLPPPPKVVPKAPEPVATSTARERFAQHSSDPACAGCHKLIDPLGFGLENYDAIGQYRETENGKPVDASGVITGTVDIDGPFRGGVELAEKLAGSLEAQECFTLDAYRFTFGRYEFDGEPELVAAIAGSLRSGGLDLREAIVAFTRTPSFTHRTFE